MVISFILQIISVIICLVAGSYAMRIYRAYESLTSFRLVFVSLTLTIWTSLLLLTNRPSINAYIDQDLLFRISEFSLTMLFLTFAVIAYVQINPIYNRLVRLFGAISFSSFVILIGFTFSEVTGTHNFIKFLNVDGLWIIETDPLYTLAIITGILSFTLSYYFSSEFLKEFPRALMSNQVLLVTRRRIYYLISVITTLYLMFISFPSISPAVIAPILELLIALFVLTYVYMSYRQPFLQIGYGTNPYLMMKHHFLGYFVGTSLDTGPNIVTKSEEFFEKSKIPQISLEALNVGIITLLGINDSFKEQIAIVPVPKSDEFTSIAISFFVENPGVEDKRVQLEAPTVLGIVLPSIMVLSLKGFNSLKLKLKGMVKDFNHIDKVDEEGIKELVAKILYELTN